MAQFNFTLSDIKKQMGSGLGLRSNKYLIEIPVPGSQSKKIAVLARSTSLPERTISKVECMYKGRPFRMRAETTLDGSYVINLIDDSEMVLRGLFESWMKEVDDTTPSTSNALGVFGSYVQDLAAAANGVVKFLNEAKTAFTYDKGLGFLTNALTDNPGSPRYQVELKVWQLDASGHKIAGYKLQNAFPTNLGAVEVAEDEENMLSQFSVELTYSDMEYIQDESFGKSILNSVLGKDGRELVTGVQNLIDYEPIEASNLQNTNNQTVLPPGSGQNQGINNTTKTYAYQRQTRDQVVNGVVNNISNGIIRN